MENLATLTLQRLSWDWNNLTPKRMCVNIVEEESFEFRGFVVFALYL
jgi:hypothetical protein